MSHTVRHSAPDWTSPTALIKAFDALGWKVETNVKCRTWSGNADRNKIYKWVAKNPSQHGYDLGIVQGKDGKLVIEGDTSMMGNDVWSTMGSGFTKLKQEYGVQSVLEWADARNGSAKQERLANGTIVMEVDVEVFA